MRDDYMAPGYQWSFDTPINLQVEDAINKLRLPRVDEDMNEERVINTIVKYYVDPAAKMKDFYLNKISKR